MNTTSKILFLDIDGVVNRGRDQIRGFNWSDPDCVAMLNRVLRDTNADIVISSSWRIGSDLQELAKHFTSEFGIKGNFISMTPVLEASRAEEIHAWITNNNYTGQYAIIDDYNIFGAYLGDEADVWDNAHIRKRFVRLQPWAGLDTDSMLKLIDILNSSNLS